jgi:hypothetical protein
MRLDTVQSGCKSGTLRWCKLDDKTSILTKHKTSWSTKTRHQPFSDLLDKIIPRDFEIILLASQPHTWRKTSVPKHSQPAHLGLDPYTVTCSCTKVTVSEIQSRQECSLAVFILRKMRPRTRANVYACHCGSVRKSFFSSLGWSLYVETVSYRAIMQCLRKKFARRIQDPDSFSRYETWSEISI